MKQEFASIEEGLAELRQGRMIVVLDNENREYEGDLIIAAEKITAESINFMTKFGGGVICLTLTEEAMTRLSIPLIQARDRHPNQAAFAASFEAIQGVTTGASAYDRAHSIRVAASPTSTAADISMPGHVFPLQARAGGVLERAGHTEASVDLARLAGLQPAAVLCEVLKEDGTMAKLADLQKFVKQHQLKMISIDDLINYRVSTELFVEEVASSDLPMAVSDQYRIKVFRHHYDKTEHIALVHKKLDTSLPCLVRIHSECITGDAFGSLRCDCGPQLEQSLKLLADHPGILIYMRQEGRGIGLSNKIKAYQLQQSHGLDTVEANQKLGFREDHRSYVMSAQILRALGVSQVRLLTNNPHKVQEVTQFGIQVVERLPLEVQPRPENLNYLRTKRDKLGHLLTLHHNE